MTSSDPRTYIENLKLKNYRLFDSLQIDFHPELTVLVAQNGGGKTALLDGIATSLRLFVDVMQAKTGSSGFDTTDILRELGRERQMLTRTPVRLEANGIFAGARTSWARERATDAPNSRTTTREATELSDRANELITVLDQYYTGEVDVPPVLPIVAFYPTGRLWNQARLTKARRTRTLNPKNRTKGYLNALSSNSQYAAFTDWFRRYSYEAQKDASGGASQHEPDAILKGVRLAVKRVIKPTTGWTNLRWDFVEDDIRAEHEQFGRLPVWMLSDGIRSMISLTADIAHRMVRLNPQLKSKAALQTPGIVIIDEVDMHLHPEWQQVVLGSLREAFPKVQFIVTTHSPQVLSTVKAESIRIIERDGVGGWRGRVPHEETRGVESAQVMADVMGVDPLPRVPEVELLADYQRLLDDDEHETAHAQDLFRKLLSHFGRDSQTIEDLEKLKRWKRFKAERET